MSRKSLLGKTRTIHVREKAMLYSIRKLCDVVTMVRILTWLQSCVHHRRDHSITPLTIRVHFKLGAYSWFSSSVGCCIVSMGHYGRQASLPFQQEQSQDSRWIQYPSILNYSRPCLCIQSFFPAHTCISRTEYPPKVHPLAVLNFKKTCIETIKPVSLRY